MSDTFQKGEINLEFSKVNPDWEASQIWSRKPLFLVKTLTQYVQTLVSNGCPVYMIHELPEDVIPGRDAELIPKTSWKDFISTQERLTHIISEYPHTGKIIEETGFFGSLGIIAGLELTPQTERTHPIEKVIWWRMHPKGIDEAGLSESISLVGQDFLLLCLDCDGERLNTLATKEYFWHCGRLHDLLGVDAASWLTPPLHSPSRIPVPYSTPAGNVSPAFRTHACGL